MSKKNLLARSIDIFFPDAFYRLLSNITGNKKNLIVLAYHRVMDFDEKFPYDIELISASLDQFDQQMEFLSKYYNPVSMEEVVNSRKNGTKLADNSVLVTFDDGFEDNYQYAFPVLKKHGVPATIFISTEYIGKDDTLWFDKLAYVIKNSQSDHIKSEVLNKTFDLTQPDQREIVLEEILEILKLIPNARRLDVLGEIFSSESELLLKRNKSLSSTLSWDQISEMDKSCISFGSHTVSHPVLSQLSDKELLDELKESKSIIEEHLSHSIDTIAYPVGTSYAFNDKVIECTKSAGYILGFSYIGGVNLWPHSNLYALKRLHVERYTSIQFFKCMISIPAIFNY